jgi:hypothetical protein
MCICVDGADEVAPLSIITATTEFTASEIPTGPRKRGRPRKSRYSERGSSIERPDLICRSRGRLDKKQRINEPPTSVAITEGC